MRENDDLTDYFDYLCLVRLFEIVTFLQFSFLGKKISTTIKLLKCGTHSYHAISFNWCLVTLFGLMY